MNISPNASLAYMAWSIAAIIAAGLLVGLIWKTTNFFRIKNKTHLLWKMTNRVKDDVIAIADARSAHTPRVVTLEEIKVAVALYEELRSKPEIKLPLMEEYLSGIDKLTLHEISIAMIRFKEAREERMIQIRLSEVILLEVKRTEFKQIEFLAQRLCGSHGGLAFD